LKVIAGIYRILRTIKTAGSTNDRYFEMSDAGLEVDNPSELFLSDGLRRYRVPPLASLKGPDLL
jgi:predicted ATP-dependent serine protease